MAIATVKSAERVLRILELFAITRRPQSVSDVEDILDLPQSSASVLLHSLVRLGYLEYLPAERLFRPTLRVKILGDWLKDGLSSGPLSARLDALHRKTNETVIIGRRNGPDVQFIYVLQSKQQVRVYMREGARRPLTLSASGRALLSTMSADVVRKITRRINAETQQPSRHVDENALLGALEEIRRSRISETDYAFGGVPAFGSGNTFEHHAIATLVPCSEGVEQITVGIAGPRQRILHRREALIEALREWTTVDSAPA